jgi:hypothetical protein
MLCRLTPDTDQRPHISAPTDITLLVSTKLSERKGFIHNTGEDVRFKNLRDIKIEQTVFGKTIGYGDIVINTSASGGYQ